MFSELAIIRLSIFVAPDLAEQSAAAIGSSGVRSYLSSARGEGQSRYGASIGVASKAGRLHGRDACASDCFCATECSLRSVAVRAGRSDVDHVHRKATIAAPAVYGRELHQAASLGFPREIPPMLCIGKTPVPICALHARNNTLPFQPQAGCRVSYIGAENAGCVHRLKRCFAGM